MATTCHTFMIVVGLSVSPTTTFIGPHLLPTVTLNWTTYWHVCWVVFIHLVIKGKLEV